MPGSFWVAHVLLSQIVMPARILNGRRTHAVSFQPWLNSPCWWWLVSSVFLIRTPSFGPPVRDGSAPRVLVRSCPASLSFMFFWPRNLSSRWARCDGSPRGRLWRVFWINDRTLYADCVEECNQSHWETVVSHFPLGLFSHLSCLHQYILSFLA